MRYPLTLVVTLCLAGVAFSQAPPRIYAPERDDDVWASYRKLTWDDFRGRLQNWGPEQAMLASTIEIEDLKIRTSRVDGSWEARVERLEIVALMQKLESSARSSGRNGSTLRHEQGHFDITEIGARRLRRRVSELVGLGESAFAAQGALESAVEAAHLDALRSVERMQAEYDGETGNGRRKGKQRAWWKQLDRLLAETDGW